MIEIEIDNLDPLLERMAAFPVQSAQVVEKTMEASLLTLWESVPAYPAYSSDYVRTGTLGRSLGSGPQGGNSGGTPDIYEVRQAGGFTEGTFGTRLSYAPFVIGEYEQAEHMQHWWTMGDVLTKATDKINALWEAAADELAKWLDGK